MKVIRETSIRYMALLIVFAMLAGVFPAGVFADTYFESDAETNIIQEYTEPEGEGKDTEPETDTLEKQLTDAEKVAASKDAIATAIDNLEVSNETTECDILTAAQDVTLYDVVVEWDDDHGFSKIDATSSNEGSITGTLELALNTESDAISIVKMIEQLSVSEDEKLEESEEFPAGKLETTRDIESDTIYKINNLGSLALQNVVMSAAYSPTIYLTLDGQAASPGKLNGFSTVSSSILSDMSYVYIDDYLYYLTESPIGTGRFPITQSITGDKGFGLKDSGTWMISFNYLFNTNKFTLSESNPTPQVNMFTVTYNPGSYGTGSVQKRLAAHDVNFTLRDAMYTRSGYEQTGWATSDTGNKVYNLGAGTYINAKTDLYPTWNAVLYPVTIYVKKDGAKWDAGSPNITFGTTAGTVINGTSVVEGTYNIYANGTDTGKDVTVNGSSASVDLNYYTVTFRNEDNTVLNTQIVLSGQTAVYDGITPTKPSTAQYSYTFSKWVNAVGGTTAILTNITAAKIVLASFTSTLRSYTISFNSAGGSAVTSISQDFGTNVVSPHAPTKTGYTFTGWTPEVPSTMPASNMTLVAQWSINSNTISYALNGGTVSWNPASYTIESTNITLNNPTRAGYSFVGWTGSNGDTAQISITIAIGSTGDKSYTANWKANAPTLAPEASILTSKTDTSITITTQDGYEYSVDGTTWHSGTAGSYTFTGLTAGKNYNLVCRKGAVTTGNTSAASEASPALSVRTKYAAPAAPSINIDLAEESFIRLMGVNGAEYSKDDGETWQDSNEFSGLIAAKQYTFAIRIKETHDTIAGIKASKTQYTAAETPAVGEGYNFSLLTEEITISNGYEISTNLDFSDGLVASGSTITPGATYYVRVAASGDVPKSFSIQFTLPTRPAAPSAIVVSKTSGSITATTIVGQEYKIDSEAWQVGGSFTGLSPNTDYTVSTRVKATDTTFASTVYSMGITTKSVGSVNVPTLDDVIYNPGRTLANITLPDNWAWSSPVTVPTVTISSYIAVYTPTDTDTVDYASVTGYAVDGNGTVTISETVSLTVNRATPTPADFTYTSQVDLDYDGTAKSATVVTKDSISGMGLVMVKYYKDGVETDPINAGTYTVKIDIEEGDNYTTATDVTAWTFTIAKIPQAQLSIIDKPDSITYGDTFTLDITGGSGAGAVTWAILEGGSATVDGSAITISGVNETTITATKAADGNYTADVTDTYTFTPDKLQLTIDSPTTEGGWTKVYDGSTEFDKALITVGSISNKVGDDDVRVSVASATYDMADVDTGKKLTIVYAIEGDDSENYFIPVSTLIDTASITPATPTVALVDKTIRYNRSVIEIDPATVTGIAVENDITVNYDSIVTYIYYTKDTCTDDDKTTVDRSGAEAIGGAPKYSGTYYVKAFVPANGNYSESSSTAAVMRIYNSSSGGSSTPQPPENTIVTVNGEPASAGTETKTTEDGKSTTLVQVNNKVIESKIEEAIKNNDTGLGNAIQISTADKDSEVVAFELTGDIVRRMEENAFSVSFKNNDIEYIIPAEEFTISKVAETLNIRETDLKKITVEVRITKLNEQTVEDYNEVAKANGAELLFPPVSFEVVAKTTKADGSTEEVKIEKFSNYVERVMEIPEGVDQSKITTGIVFNLDGTYSHVPTLVYEMHGKLYARINSLTNSTYSIIWSPVTVKSVENHWSKDIVNDMSSRLIIKNSEEFMPNQNITRGEFAEYITKALGIYRSGIVDTQKFSDVEATHELAYSIEIASEYGIIGGYPDGSFKPCAQISREEAMVMYSRAMAIAGLEKGIDRINNYTDKDSIAEWAYNDVKNTISAGVFNGKTDKTINPKDTFTFAEAATAIRNLLVAKGLINE